MSLLRPAFVCRVVAPLLMVLPFACVAHAADQFTKPTKEELSMTSLPGYPGVSAVVLNKEELDRDDMHVKTFYARIKILTEKGKDLANVVLPFVSTSGDIDSNGDRKDITDIVGRTVHPDGTVIPFTGKPYLKTVQKMSNAKFQERVFTLPDVEVGSIIEYRYSERIDDHIFEAPDWYVQGPLYVKAAHYAWYPTTKSLIGSSGSPINALSWFPVLPAGTKVENIELPNTGNVDVPPRLYELHIKDVPPVPEEEYQPPTKSFTYRVMFNFTEYHSPNEFWKGEGKDLFKRVNSFSSPSDGVRSVVSTVTAGAATQDEKLKKIYAAVEALENTDYTRSRERAEDKAAGLGKVSGAADVLEHKRGSSWQITTTFLAMAKAAGMKAYGMYVPDRTEHLFSPQWLNMGQLDELIAIVVVDGKEVYFDPGERFCEYGHLAWQHTSVTGLRDSGDGIKLEPSPSDVYTANRTTRVANLTMDDKGVVSGKVSLSYWGAPAMAWRHRALAGDEQSIKRALRVSLERMVPRSLDVKVDSMTDLASYDKPLVVNYNVKGVISSATGKRLVLPPDLFTMNDVALFPHEKREEAVYFHYPQLVQDAQRVNLPASIKVEAVPDSLSTMFQKSGSYKLELAQGPTFVTARRTLAFGEVIVPTGEYPQLRTFYSALQSKDKEPVVLSAAETLDLPKVVATPEHAPEADEDESEADDDSGGN